MKTAIPVALSLLLLAGCGKEPASPLAQPTTGANASIATECPETTTYDPMPPGVVVGVPFHLRSDRITSDSKGNYRRRVTFEYLSGDAASVFDSIVGSVTGAGYSAKERKEKDGRLSIGFNKKGIGALLLSVNPNAVPKPAHPDAKGMFVLDFPYRGKVESTGALQNAPTSRE